METTTPRTITDRADLADLEPETVFIDGHGNLVDVTTVHGINPATEDMVFTHKFHVVGAATLCDADDVNMPVTVQPFGW